MNVEIESVHELSVIMNRLYERVAGVVHAPFDVPQSGREIVPGGAYNIILT